MDTQQRQDEPDRRMWRRLARSARPTRAGAGPCPDELALAAYLDGSASADEVERMEAHLAACDACLRAVGELRSLLREGPILAPPQVVQRAKALVPQTAAGGAAMWRRVGRWATAAAAAVAIGYGGFLAGADTSRTRNSLQSALAAEMTFGLEDASGRALLDEEGFLMLGEEQR